LSCVAPLRFPRTASGHPGTEPCVFLPALRSVYRRRCRARLSHCVSHKRTVPPHHRSGCPRDCSPHSDLAPSVLCTRAGWTSSAPGHNRASPRATRLRIRNKPFNSRHEPSHLRPDIPNIAQAAPLANAAGDRATQRDVISRSRSRGSSSASRSRPRREMMRCSRSDRQRSAWRWISAPR